MGLLRLGHLVELKEKEGGETEAKGNGGLLRHGHLVEVKRRKGGLK
jgi:hypothetical protein